MDSKPKEYINHIDLADNTSVGNERRAEILQQTVDKAAFSPKPVLYKDIDDAFKEWVKSLKLVTEDGFEYPTMALFSNQRFSEYSQTWQYTDNNKNLLLNFKTVTRENNPQYGKIESGLWNIPGDRFYRIKRMKVLDDNGTESLLDISMRQPMAVDLIYKLSLFTNLYESLNKFNVLVNKQFRSRQRYIAPNGYYMPMILENISDESEYSIDNRQFYSQTYSIRLMGYVIEESDFRITEIPLKRAVRFAMTVNRKNLPEVDVEEFDCEGDVETPSTVITISYPKNVNSAEFTIDEDLMIDSYEYENLSRKCRVFVDGDECDTDTPIRVRDGQTIKVLVKRRNALKDATLKLICHDPHAVGNYDSLIVAEEIDYSKPFDGNLNNIVVDD